jgi:hypothetical protein
MLLTTRSAIHTSIACICTGCRTSNAIMFATALGSGRLERDQFVRMFTSGYCTIGSGEPPSEQFLEQGKEEANGR